MKRDRILISSILTAIWSRSGRIYRGTKKFLWDHRQGIQLIFTFLSLALLIIAIGISYRTLQESQKFGSTMIAQMDTLSHLFTKVNEQISYLPASVSRFDSTITKLDEGIGDQQQEFQKSIGGLQRNIDAFSKGIADYGMTLAKIVSASDKQLALLDSRQKLLEKELMKRPRLRLQVKECGKDTLGRLRIAPWIVNEGDRIATFCLILLKVHAAFEFESPDYKVADSTAAFQAWTCLYSKSVPYGLGVMIHNQKMDFSIKTLAHSKPPYALLYYLYHDEGVNTD
ncbi:hypothetical protein KA005_00035, partial [bacterium]|nr:hypothetical protein [bacterium]